METMIQYRYEAYNDTWVCEHVDKGTLVTMSGKYVRDIAEKMVLPDMTTFRMLVAELLLTMFEHTDNPMDEYVLTKSFNADNMQRVMVGLSAEPFKGVM